MDARGICLLGLDDLLGDVAESLQKRKIQTRLKLHDPSIPAEMEERPAGGISDGEDKLGDPVTTHVSDTVSAAPGRADAMTEANLGDTGDDSGQPDCPLGELRQLTYSVKRIFTVMLDLFVPITYGLVGGMHLRWPLKVPNTVLVVW